MAYKQENPDAAIASLSLDRMATKEFDKNLLQIEAPMPNDINERMVNEDLETEDEITADPRQLYKRFEDMFIKEQQNAWHTASNFNFAHNNFKPNRKTSIETKNNKKELN